MASNSQKPNSEKNHHPEELRPDHKGKPSSDIESLDDDLGFWSIDTDASKISESSENIEEIEELLKESITPVGTGATKSLAEAANKPAELKRQHGEKLIEKLAEANSKTTEDNSRTISQEDIEEFNKAVEEDIKDTAKRKRAAKKVVVKRTLVEKIATTFCILFLLGTAYFIYDYYNKHIEVLTDDKWATNLPVEGEYADLKSSISWWSNPVSKAKLGVKLVPCIQITLADNAKSGILRVIFYSSEEGLNGQKRAKGDQATLPFTNGKFVNGSNTIAIQGTDGFESLAEFQLYKSQMEKRWTANIEEAPVGSSDYKQLGHAPIDPIRRIIKDQSN